MAEHKVYKEINETYDFGTADAGMKKLVFASAVPSDTTAGYSTGCILVHTGLSDESDALYINLGTSSSCNFNAVTVAADE